MASRWRIIKTEPSAERQRQLLQDMANDRETRSVFKAAVREAVESDPELRDQVRRVAGERTRAVRRRHLEAPIERGGDRPTLLVEGADGKTRRIDRDAGDPRTIVKSKRASFRDVLAAPVWNGTRYVHKG